MLAAMLAIGGCHPMSLDEEELVSRGLSHDDLNAPPNDNEIHARVVNDVRNVWIPQAQLDRGLPSCPGLRMKEGKPVCTADGAALKEIALRTDARDRQHPETETAFYCPTESIYWYHYEGGPESRDVWLGPKKVKFARPKH